MMADIFSVGYATECGTIFRTMVTILEILGFVERNYFNGSLTILNSFEDFSGLPDNHAHP